MWIQILHLLVILIFSFLDFHNILSGQTEYPNYVDVPAFVLFLNFLSTFIIGHYIKKLISIRALWTKFKNLKEEHVVFTQIIIDFIQMIVAIIQVPILHDKSIFFSRYTTLIIIMLIINLIISFFSSKFGVYELYFGFFVSPCLILWTQSALFKYCMLRSVLNFGPITLQYIVLVLIYPQDFKSYGMDNKSPVQHGIEMEIRNPNFTYPLAKLFGRQDSFRLIFILFNYCCFDAFYDYCKFGDSEYNNFFYFK